MLITDAQTNIHTHKSTIKNEIFGFTGSQKRVYPSKSPLRTFDPKTVLSLPCMGKKMSNFRTRKKFLHS